MYWKGSGGSVGVGGGSDGVLGGGGGGGGATYQLCAANSEAAAVASATRCASRFSACAALCGCAAASWGAWTRAGVLSAFLAGSTVVESAGEKMTYAPTAAATPSRILVRNTNF